MDDKNDVSDVVKSMFSSPARSVTLPPHDPRAQARGLR